MHLDLNFQIRLNAFTVRAQLDLSGSAFGLFGPSGSGKSTLLRAIAGLVRPDSGRIALDGEVLFDQAAGIWIPPHRRRIGVVFQDARLFPHWNTEKNLRAGSFVSTQSGPFSWDQIVTLLELRPLLTRPVQNLSGGEKQRVALGRALLAHPRLLLMDEPVSGLDAELKQQILPFLLRVHGELNLPCLMVSHHLPEILQLTDQLIIMKDGAVCGQDSLDRLVTQRETFEMLRRSGLMSFITLPVDGKPVRVGIRPDEVMLATHPIEGLSARHRIQGTLIERIDHGETVLCRIAAGENQLLVDVTPAAVRELNLNEGGSVWCFFKASAVFRL